MRATGDPGDPSRCGRGASALPLHPAGDALPWVVGALAGIRLEHAMIGRRLRRVYERPRIQALLEHNVQLCTEQRDLGLEVEPPQDRDDRGEMAVCRLSLLQVVRNDQ